MGTLPGRINDVCQMVGRQTVGEVPGVTIVVQFLATFKEYPPSQMGGTLSIERALALVQQGASGGGH
jgi:hypothetical protein